MSRRLVARCVVLIVLAIFAQHADAQASSWHPRHFLRGNRQAAAGGGGGGNAATADAATIIGESSADDADELLSAAAPDGSGDAEPARSEEEAFNGGDAAATTTTKQLSTGVGPKTTPAEQQHCGCLAGVHDYGLHPAGDFWTTAPLPVPETLEGALKAASSPGKVALVMMTNAGELDLVDNFLCSLRMVGINKYLIFATDAPALTQLRERGYHAWSGRSIVGKGLDQGDSEFRSKSWKTLVQAKLKVADTVLRAGYHLFFSDVDVVALDNFLPDLVAPSQKNGQWLVDWDGHPKSIKEANTGFYFMRAEQDSLDLLTKAFAQQRKVPSWDDQKILNAVMPARLKNYMPRPKFSNGCFLRSGAGKSGELRKLGVSAVHVNCAVSKLMKHKLMCNNGLWFCANVPAGGNPKGAGGKCRVGYGMERFTKGGEIQ